MLRTILVMLVLSLGGCAVHTVQPYGYYQQPPYQTRAVVIPSPIYVLPNTPYWYPPLPLPPVYQSRPHYPPYPRPYR